MVTGIPSIKIPEKLCENCVMSKQPRNSFSDYVPLRAKSVLGVVHQMYVDPLMCHH